MSLHLDYCAEFGLSKEEIEQQEEHQGIRPYLSVIISQPHPLFHPPTLSNNLYTHSLHRLHPLRSRHRPLGILVRAATRLCTLPPGLRLHRQTTVRGPGNGETRAGESVLEVDTELCGG